MTPPVREFIRGLKEAKQQRLLEKEEQTTDEEAKPRVLRHKKGKSRTTIKRKQNADERAAKRQVRGDRKAQVDADGETPHKPCNICIKASQVAADGHQRCLTKSQAHSRASNKDCTGYLLRSQARLFTIAPVAAFTRKYVKIDHETLGIILRYFGLGQHAAMPHTSVPADRPHANFNIIDLNKMKVHGAFENSLLTDGFAASITFKKLVPENPLPSLALDDIKEGGWPHTVERPNFSASLQALPQLLSHYGVRYQQLRFYNYKGKQKVQKEMVDIFLTGGAKYNG
ncbi:hypothetical protein DFQ28_011401 [Apophysomyces sp. BC1034]|nr:hypothetical protein DFQ30_011288 [Apophysomyces sp. BC1015]KAG0169131.1 hypothetical protein DFQ29_009874 [Apophysomyces sp. BC1021]KAG0184323.1 hypothetical protein DFQ28_011401 [Apophysomyces sp. BC1034]